MMIHQLFSRTLHRSARFWALLLALSLAAGALLAFAGASRTAAQSITPEQFTGCSYNTGSNATVIIPEGAPQIHTAGYFVPAPGDEFAIFRPVAGVCSPAPSLCAGSMIWQGFDDAMTVWGDNTAVAGVDGMLANELMCWRVWDQSEDKYYTATVEYDDTPPFDTSGRYNTNGIYGLLTLSPTALKLASFEAASDTAWITRSALLAGSALLLTAGLLFARWRKQRA